MLKAWMDFAFDSALLCAEAQEVMALRLMKLASGGAHAHSAALRMMTEKGLVFAEAAGSLAFGVPVERVMRRYRSIVRANKRRLSR